MPRNSEMAFFYPLFLQALLAVIGFLLLVMFL